MMIHRTFECPKALERLLIYIGVLVGIGGPSAIITIHDTRDWAQRLRDVTWQLFYRFEFDKAPIVKIESRLARDSWIRFFDKTWRLHQLVLALILFAIGGLPWVVWGVCFRVAVSTIGHWSITYVCHNPGPGRWHVKNAGVQASNLNFKLVGLLTHGECWHNNHHAFPESAIRKMQNLGWATDIKLPRNPLLRSDLLERVSTKT